MSLESRVLSEAFYVARLVPDWKVKPFWLMRRCVVPYITARQFMLLRRDDLPIAFVGWVWESDEIDGVQNDSIPSKPWRHDNYLPSASDFLLSKGHCCVTEVMSPVVPAEVVLREVAKWLKLDTIPTRIEVNGDRKVVAVHQYAFPLASPHAQVNLQGALS